MRFLVCIFRIREHESISSCKQSLVERSARKHLHARVSASNTTKTEQKVIQIFR